jgi:organic radical activating enzyme
MIYSLAEKDRMRNDRIRIDRCEVNVAHHCNLSCRGCSHLSPKAEKYFADPGQVFVDLSLLGRHCRPDRICLVGGEPLLHPDLQEVIGAVRRSGIQGRIRVTTNGLLLCRMPDSFWSGIDEVCISLYPGFEADTRQAEEWLSRAKANRVRLVLRHVDRFCEPYAELGTSDAALVRRIYSTCRIAHIWRCHTIHEGFFHLCPSSVFIPRIIEDKSGEDAQRDGLRLGERATFPIELKDFLSRKEPLESCRFCLGSAGKRFEPVQEPRSAPGTLRKTEDLVDWDLLGYLEKDHFQTTTKGREC